MNLSHVLNLRRLTTVLAFAHIPQGAYALETTVDAERTGRSVIIHFMRLNFDTDTPLLS